jgi:hypothetical protein
MCHAREYGHPGFSAHCCLDPRFGGCVIIHNNVLQGIIIRVKALAYIDNGMIIHSLWLPTYLPVYVAQGFNPAKADCDTDSFVGMTYVVRKAPRRLS